MKGAARASLLAVVSAALILAPAAAADLADERALAEKYAPVVRIVEQEVDRRIVWRSVAGKKTGGG